MHKGYLKTAALLGALSVMLGAFASHELNSISSQVDIEVFKLGIQYQFYHVFALTAVGILYGSFNKSVLRWSGIFFILGIILFSGSIYLITLLKGYGFIQANWFRPVTPFGGSCFIIGWILFFAGLIKPPKVI